MGQKNKNSEQKKANKNIGKGLMILGLVAVIFQMLHAMYLTSKLVNYETADPSFFDLFYYSFPPAAFFIGYQIYRNNEN